MARIEHFRLLARYNAWMNGRLYDAAATLPPEVLTENRGAFFGSLLGTLEHIVVGDTLWLKRFATHPAAGHALDPVVALPSPTALDQIQFGALGPLREQRDLMDRAIEAFVAELDETALDHPLAYRSSKGVASTRNFGLVLTHFFNHQTHHRGQATTLLSQAGVDVGATDLLLLIPALD